MNDYYFAAHSRSQQEPTRPQQYLPLSQFIPEPRHSVPRERYRATQYADPMYDIVEDDEHGQSELLDSFDRRMLQLSYTDRQSQAAQGRGRLSLAPAPSRLHGDGVIEREYPRSRLQTAYQDTQGDEDQRVCASHAVRDSFSRFAYNAHEPLDSSSDPPVGASSSPALKAGRRRAGEHSAGLSQQTPQSRLQREAPDHFMPNRPSGFQHLREANERPIGPPRQDAVGSFQPVTTARHSIDEGSSYLPPIVQGIVLVPVSALPDRLRTVFPFPNFNAVQSKCFDEVFKSDNNFVLSSPTGSGKTAVLELAICRAVANNSTGKYKIVYQAPTKALCSERQRDWKIKFTQIGLTCAELTGDSDAADLRGVQSANIIITTPEKWDSMTRKWQDHEKLMRLIKVFLIDEVHILNDDRGAVLETVVSRMKSIGTDVRFVALSATIPNFQDVAVWLGKSSSEPNVPAPNEKFGEEFRPVRLRKHVCGYVYSQKNDYAFDKHLDARLPEVIAKYSERKPMMIFCPTRKICYQTAQRIAIWWSLEGGRDRLWNPPSRALHIQDKENRDLVLSGVATHHGGLGHEDRTKVEQAFLQGDISVICCTSTLAVGVNLPCHLVIVKNTVKWSNQVWKEYSDLEMMQMLGRAGRPQFDDTAVAVIMTRHTKARRYESLATGGEIIESKLHLNLVDHLNAEIGLGTIRDFHTARKWLNGTFLYVRLRQNPTYYKLDGSRSGQDLQEQVEDILHRDITLLRENNLVSGDENFRCTEFGHIMARYYVQFGTMKVFMGLQPKPSLSEILSAMAQAAEFSDVRFRQGEKSLYKTLNKSPCIRFPIPVNLDIPAQKVSLIIQSVLGHAEIAWEGDMARHKTQYLQEVIMILKSTNSLVRCIIDCQLHLGDSVGAHGALMLERSLGSKAWDDTALQMIQIPSIGNVATRKLVNAGIQSIEDLESTEARRIETIVGKNPPFGLSILNALKSFPKLRVSLHLQPSSVIRTPEGIRSQVKADIGFINEKPPLEFNRKAIYVCLLAETSDGRKAHFVKMHGRNLVGGQTLVFPVLLTSPDQSINCYVMCDGIAGTLRYATIAPGLAPSMFPIQVSRTVEPAPIHEPNTSRRRVENAPMKRGKSVTSDDFEDDDLDDDALVKATCGDLDFDHIDNFADPTEAITRSNTAKNALANGKGHTCAPPISCEDDDNAAPTQLPNGRRACNHKCRDREACKHECCKIGAKKPAKKVAPKCVTNEYDDPSPPAITVQRKAQTKLNLQASKRKSSGTIEELDLTQQEKKRKNEYAMSGPRDFRDLHTLHKNVQKKDLPPSLHSVSKQKPSYCYSEGGEHQLSFLSQSRATRPKTPSEYGGLELEELDADVFIHEGTEYHANRPTSIPFLGQCSGSDTFEDDDSVFAEVIVGLADSQDLQDANATVKPSIYSDEVGDGLEDLADDDADGSPKRQDRLGGPFLEATSSPEKSGFFGAGESGLEEGERDVVSQAGQGTKDEMEEEEDMFSDVLDMLDVPLQDVAGVRAGPREGSRGVACVEELQPWVLREFGDIVEVVDE